MSEKPLRKDPLQAANGHHRKERSRWKPFSHLCRCILFSLPFFLSLALPMAAEADIASVEAEIAVINTQITDATNITLIPLEAEIDELKAGMEEARTYMNAFAKRNDWLLAEYNAHRHRLKEYEGRVLQLGMSYGDFFDAKNKWEASSDPAERKAQILIMFRYLYGNSREPSQWELDPSTQQDFVDMADLIVRKKAVARMGEALVLLGELTVELVEAITGIPKNLKEAAFATIEFAAKATSKLLPDDAVKSLNETCLRYIPFLEFQKARAEQLANELNEIRNREEFGGENGRLEAQAKAQALVDYEREVLAELEPEMNEYLTRKSGVEANFAAVQGELNDKIEERETLRQTLRQYTQNRIDKEFELKQLQEQKAIDDNGGPTNYVQSLSIGTSAYELAADALSSALLDLPRYARLTVSAGYVTEKPAQCSYSVKVGEETVTQYESYHLRYPFTAPVSQPVWHQVGATGEVTIAENQAFGVAAGVVPLQAGLSPALVSESYKAQNCSSDYLPVGGDEKSSALSTIHVRKVAETLFIPAYYYYKEKTAGITAEALFGAMKTAAATYGKGIDLFVGGKLQQTGDIAIYYTVLNADGTTTLDFLAAPPVRPEGYLAAFEIDNQMKVLGTGSANLRPILLDRDGLQLPPGTVAPFAVTGNKVEATVGANGVTELTPADAVTVVINEPAQFALSVEGPADMNQYEVRWRYFIYKTTGYPTGWQPFDRHDGASVTSFSGSLGNGTSLNPTTLTDPKDFNQTFKIEFDIVRTYDGVVVYAGAFDRIRSILKGKGFFLASRTTGEPYPGGNYFLFRGLTYLAPAITSQNLELRLDLGDGQSVVVPLTDFVKGLLYGAESAANQNLGLVSVKDTYIYTSFSSIDACGSVDLGLYELKEPDLESLLDQLGIVVEQTANRVMTALDVNLFRVNYRETASGPVYLLKGCAPTSLEYFKVRWTFFDETTAESPFTTVGLLQESQTSMTKGLQKVEIINPLSGTAAQLGFLSASGPNSINKVSQEIRMVYTAATEYRYNGSLDGYAGQLTQLTKGGPGSVYGQFELDFQFPDGFPQVFVQTVNDINGALLPVLRNVAVDARAVAFDAVLPSAGNFTKLTVLRPPAFGKLAIDGIHVAYTLPSGFEKTDRFSIRVDGKVCDILPDVTYYNLEGEVDCSGDRPVVRLKQLFTPVYGYGEYALGFTLMDADQQTPTTGIAQAPAKLVAEATAGGASLKLGTLSGNERDAFNLSLAMPGGTAGEATVNVWHYSGYPEFFANRNQDYAIPPGLILHRFFEFFENGAQQIKDIWADPGSGELLLNGAPLGKPNLVSAADLRNMTFRPKQDYTGPTALYFYGSGDGETWSGQMRLGGWVLEGDGKAGLADLVWVLQILAGYGVQPPEPSPVADRDGDHRIGLAEALYLLQPPAGLRP